MAARSKTSSKDSTANLGFEATAGRGSALHVCAAILRSPKGNLWLTADSRSVAETAEGNRSNNMEAAEPERSGDSQMQAPRRASEARQSKHVVLGLVFLKYISDSFEEHHAKLVEGKGDYARANPEDPDEYRAVNVFWVPPAARWSCRRAHHLEPPPIPHPRHPARHAAAEAAERGDCSWRHRHNRLT